MRESRYNTWVRAGDGSWRVHNGVSGELCTLENDERVAVERWLAGGPIGAGRQPLLESLIRSFVLVHDDADEIAMLRARYRRGQHDPTHMGLTVVTSMGCNFDCPYCFESKSPALLQPEVAEAIRALVRERSDTLGTLDVTWYGGEPLLGLEQLIELSGDLMGDCAAAGISYRAMVVTNGWYLDGPTAESLSRVGVTVAQVGVDGPPAVHDRRRAHVGGKPTFDRIVTNIRAASEHMGISVRTNVDAANVGRLAEMLDLLVAGGLVGRVGVGLGHVVPVSHNPEAPSSGYATRCLTPGEYARVEVAFAEMARERGFATAELPGPVEVPCTAVRANEMIVGARGEIWKCLDDAGNEAEQIGTIFDLEHLDSRLARWLGHDPFTDDECLSCVALPGCMGGCALYGATPGLREHRCSSFRRNHRQRVLVASGVGSPPSPDGTGGDLSGEVAVPVSITPRPVGAL